MERVNAERAAELSALRSGTAQRWMLEQMVMHDESVHRKEQQKMAQSFTKSKASAHNLGGGTSSTLPPPLAQAPEMDAVGAVVFNQIRKGSIRRLRRSFELESPGSFRRSSSSASPREEKAPDFGRGDEGEAEGDAPAEEAAMELRQYDGFDGRRQEEEDERERRASSASNASAVVVRAAHHHDLGRGRVLAFRHRP